MSYFAETKCPNCGKTKQHHLGGFGWFPSSVVHCTYCGVDFDGMKNQISCERDSDYEEPKKAVNNSQKDVENKRIDELTAENAELRQQISNLQYMISAQNPLGKQYENIRREYLDICRMADSVRNNRYEVKTEILTLNRGYNMLLADKCSKLIGKIGKLELLAQDTMTHEIKGFSTERMSDLQIMSKQLTRIREISMKALQVIAEFAEIDS